MARLFVRVPPQGQVPIPEAIERLVHPTVNVAVA